MTLKRSQSEVLDEWLVLRIQSGDRRAMQILITRWQPRLLTRASRLTGSIDAAADVAQDTWIAAVRGLPRLDDPARFRSWLFRILNRRAADWVRDRQRGRRNVDRASTMTTVRASDAEGTVARVRSALTRLPAEQRVILSMLYLDGLSVREIAYALDALPGTIKSRLYHAREALKRVIQENDDAESP